MRLKRSKLRRRQPEVNKRRTFFANQSNEEKSPFFPGNETVQRKLSIGKSNDSQEKEAESIARQLTRQQIQRAEKKEEEKPIQKEEKKEEEKPIQKEEKKEEEKPVQKEEKKEEEKPIQKEEKKEEEKPVQKEEKKEEEKPIQKEEKKEEEKPVQKEEKKEEEKPIQKAEKKEEEEPVQKAAYGSAKEGPGGRELPTIESILARRKGMGAELEKEIRLQMEKKMNTSFKNVRIHTDAEAEELCEQIHALAFTHGSDIYFNKGQFKPDSDSGKELLAHELAHVVQQQG